MLKERLAMAAVVIVVIFVLGLVLGLVGPRLITTKPAPKVYNTAAVLQQVQTLAQLVTVKYVLEKVVVVENPSQSVLGQMFAGENRVLLVAHGIVKAGIDLSKLQPGDLQLKNKKVIIKLPPPQITDAYLDEKRTQVIERTTGIFRSFDKDLEHTARQNAVDDISRSARTSGILKDADERARDQLTHLFRQLGFEEVEFRSH